MPILKTIFKPFGFLFFNQGKISRNTWIILGILALALFAAFLDYPSAWNKGADFLNAKLGFQTHKIPHFFNKPFRLGLDLQGGTHLIFEADVSQLKDSKSSDAMQGIRDVIERRVNMFGVAEPVVQVESAGDHHRLVVELAGIKDVNEAIKMIGETPFLDFREERTAEDSNVILEAQKNNQRMDEDPYFKPTELTGRYLSGADMIFDPNTGQPMVGLEFNDEGARLFEEITGRNVGKRLAIVLDGVAISAPNVNEPI
ncbi:MAG: hypothetical protein PHQ47_02725 [Candidatus Portnoybacteria bacterium]|nr:hypothetical protein [Candidatus Portnoybacteria bacterium]